MKKLFLVAVMATMALGASAQGRFFDKTFVSVGGGVNIYAGYGLMKDAQAAGAYDISVGKWFTPASGARLQWAGGSAKGWGGSMAKSFSLNTLHADYLWNISNTIGGYRVDRFWQFVPYAGLGCGMGIGGTRFGFAGGLLNKVRINKCLDANLEFRAVSFVNRFKTVAQGGNITGRTMGSITVGLSYNFGK